MKKKILFICTHNSARSQIAEGLVNHFFKDKYEAFSAGTEKTFVKPYAINALKDMGIDITHQTSKTIDTFKDALFDIVVTVCDQTQSACPIFPGKKVVHKSFKDPSNCKGTEEEKLQAFIHNRDEIKKWLDNFL